MKAVGYVRASTEDQNITIEMQEKKIKSYAEVKGLDLTAVITDKGKSGKNLNREGIQQVLKMVENKEVDSVVIYKLDRMFRSTEDALKVASFFQKEGIAFHSISESIDTASPWGKFFYTLIAAFAELERNVIGERTRTALRHKKEKGDVYGPVPYGCTRKGNRLIPNLGECHTINLITRLRNFEHYSFKKIAEYLNASGRFTRCGGKWYPQQIKNILKLKGT